MALGTAWTNIDYKSVTYNGATIGYYLDARVVSQSEVNNSSVIAVRLRSTLSGYYFTVSSHNFSASYCPTVSGGTWNFGNEEITSGTATIQHDQNGNQSISLSATCSGGGGIADASLSGSVALPTIPRGGTIELTTPAVIGQTIGLKINKAVSAYTHAIYYHLDGQDWKLIYNGAETSTTFSIPLDECSYVANSVTGNLYFWTGTYSGGQYITYTELTVRVSVPSDINPIFDALSIQDISNMATLVGRYVQNQSRLQVAIEGARGSYGSTVTSYNITIAGQTYYTQSVTVDGVNVSGETVITARITDSRGRTASKSKTIYILPYGAPSITSANFERCNQYGVADPVGAYVKASLKFSAVSLPDGNNVEWNTLSYKIKIKKQSDTEYVTKKEISLSDLAYDNWVLIDGVSADYAYEISLEVSDNLSTSNLRSLIAIGVVLMQWAKDSMSVGTLLENTDYNLVVGAKGIKVGNGILAATEAGITLLGESLADYVKNISDIGAATGTWYYIKTKAGHIIAWRKDVYTITPAQWLSWGSTYYYTIPPVSYGGIFDLVPFEHRASQTDGGWGYYDNNTQEATGNYYIVRPTTISNNLTVAVTSVAWI